MKTRAWGMLAGAGLLLGTAGPLHAGGVPASINWANSACGGSNFETCASVALESSVVGGVTVIDLTVTNLGSSGEVFASVGLMGLPAGGAGVAYDDGPSGWSAPANQLNGDGLIQVTYGVNPSPPPTANGLQNGEGATFTFTFDRLLSQQELDALGGAVHAISGPNGCSTKLGIDQDGAVREGPYDPDCVPTEVVPEPITMVLLGTGLAGVAGAARRRRRDDDVVEDETA